VLKHRPIATYDELVKECWGQTRLEALRAEREETFKNADSFALTTSLLSQLKTNKQAYQQNIATMKAALKNANHGYISGQTLVKINIL
jgi:hypothetical protein